MSPPKPKLIKSLINFYWLKDTRYLPKNQMFCRFEF